MYAELKKHIHEIENLIIEDRRKLHRTPEIAWEEHKTHAYIADRLKNLGYDIVEGDSVSGHPTGIIAELRCSHGPVTAMRFDIDGLPIEETTSSSHLPAREHFSSQHPGAMHACGHDGHISIGLACADALMHFRDKLRGTFRLIFQPAEEGCKGARPVTEKGWLDDVDYFLSGHIVGRDYDPENKYDVIPGVKASLATTKIDVTLKGRPCHASEPSKGLSVMPALAYLIEVTGRIPLPLEVQSGQEKALLNIGTVSAGEGRNIIAGSCRIEMEVRGSTTAMNSYMEKQALRILKECREKFGVEVEIDILTTVPSLSSSEELCLLSKEVCRNLGLSCSPETLTFKASEDAAVMLERVKDHGGKGIFFLFTTDTAALLHEPTYDFDESILAKAALLYCAICFNIAEY